MAAFSTYCSANKNRDEGAMKAIDRYKSDRIKSIYRAARELGVEFFILSGKFGLIKSNQSIPYYDQLLTPQKVIKHSELVADQLKQFGITNLIFFSRPFSEDEQLKPYIDCVETAAQKQGTVFKLVEII